MQQELVNLLIAASPVHRERGDETNVVTMVNRRDAAATRVAGLRRPRASGLIVQEFASRGPAVEQNVPAAGLRASSPASARRRVAGPSVARANHSRCCHWHNLLLVPKAEPPLAQCGAFADTSPFEAAESDRFGRNALRGTFHANRLCPRRGTPWPALRRGNQPVMERNSKSSCFAVLTFALAVGPELRSPSAGTSFSFIG